MIQKNYRGYLAGSAITIMMFIMFAFPCASLSSQSQDTIVFIQLNAGYGFNNYSSNFSYFQNSVDCGLFTKGSGSGLILSAEAFKPVYDKIDADLEIGYANRSGIFSIPQDIPIRELNRYNQETFKAEDRLTTTLGYLNINPGIKYTITDKLINAPLKAFAGLNFAIPLTATFEQKDIILSPADIVFLSNNKQERILGQGDIKTITSLMFGFHLGIENSLKVSDKMNLTQRVRFDYYFNNVTSDADWKLNSIDIELGLNYLITPFEKIISPEDSLKNAIEEEKIIAEQKRIQEEKAKIIEEEKIKHQPKLFIEIIDPDSSIVINKGNEILSTIPFVNAVFFERNSSTLSENYLQKPEPIPSFFEGNAVDRRKFVLLRIADIIKRNPGSSLFLEGATSGPDNESEGLELARKRTESVRQIFNSLGIPDSIISTNSRIYPQNQTNQEYREGIEENQRVDINIKNAAVQEYVGVQNYVEVDGKVKIKIDYENISDTQSIILSPEFYDTLIVCNQKGIYEIPIRKRIDSSSTAINLKAQLSYLSTEANANKQTPVDKLKTEIKKLSLSNFEAELLFEFDSSKLSDENKELLKQMSKFIPAGSTIIVYGSADMIGSEKRNIKLAGLRSQHTVQFLESVAEDKFTIETNNKHKKYSDDTPEGRFFNRSIRLKVK